MLVLFMHAHVNAISFHAHEFLQISHLDFLEKLMKEMKVEAKHVV